MCHTVFHNRWHLPSCHILFLNTFVLFVVSSSWACEFVLLANDSRMNLIWKNTTLFLNIDSNTVSKVDHVALSVCWLLSLPVGLTPLTVLFFDKETWRQERSNKGNLLKLVKLSCKRSVCFFQTHSLICLQWPEGLVLLHMCVCCCIHTLVMSLEWQKDKGIDPNWGHFLALCVCLYIAAYSCPPCDCFNKAKAWSHG